MKPLFIAVKTVYFEAIKTGKKTFEFRLYGPRWNEKSCQVGRKVTISKGYGKKHRLTAEIASFQKLHGSKIPVEHRKVLLEIFRTLDLYIACIELKNVEI